MKQSSPAAARNGQAIADVLARWLPASGLVLEVASGSGEHALHFARAFPGIRWQPSDPDAEARASAAAWRHEQGPANLLAPIALDAASVDWPIDQADAIVCINMVHISPWASTTGLMAGAARVLRPGAPLVLYGPYRRGGVPTAPSNEEFDASLKARDPAWGLRGVEAVADAASGFALEELIEMPAQNIMLLFRRTNEPST